MADKKYNDQDGVWRTIGGRRVFIKTGQSLADAMKESGKFSRVAKNQDLYKKLKENEEDKKEDKKKEEYSFSEIVDEMERANDYSDLYSASEKIADADLRKEVEDAISQAESDGFDVSEAYSTITSDYLDTKATQGEKNVGKGLSYEKYEAKIREIQERPSYKEKMDKAVKELEAKEKGIDNKEQSDFYKNLNETEKEVYDDFLSRGYSKRDIENTLMYKTQDQRMEEAGIKTITQEEYDKMSKDYKGTLKELVDTAEFRGEDKEALRKEYEAKGYDVDKDKTILEYSNGGTTLRPVKIANKESDNKHAGWELYSDDPHRYDDTIKSAQARKEKFKADDEFKKSHHMGWGSYNKDGVPVYNNDIDYKGDFGLANLETLSNDDLTKALNVQSEEYHKASKESVGDRRTRNGRMNQIFKGAKVNQYERGMKKINEEMSKRDIPRYNIYNEKNGMLLVSSPTKEMADKQIQEMIKSDLALQKEYDWKELPKYVTRVQNKEETENGFSSKNQISNALQSKAYEKYKKEHPKSKMTLADFLKKK